MLANERDLEVILCYCLLFKASQERFCVKGLTIDKIGRYHYVHVYLIQGMSSVHLGTHAHSDLADHVTLSIS